MGCRCYTIGGPFIAEDPDCPTHGRVAQRRSTHRDLIIAQLRRAIQQGTETEVWQAALGALEYLESEP